MSMNGYLDDIHMEECAECRASLGIGTSVPADAAYSAAGPDAGESKSGSLRAERGSYYGDPLINHASIGAIWSGILVQAMSSGRWRPGETIPADLVCLMMVGLKLSREAYRHKDDNILDARVYLEFVDEIAGVVGRE